MPDETLTLRHTWPEKGDDYLVVMAGVSIGRIYRHQDGIPGPPWSWSVTLAVGRADVSGAARSREDAEAAWKRCWAMVRPTLTDEWLAEELERRRETKRRNDAWARHHGKPVDPERPA